MSEKTVSRQSTKAPFNKGSLSTFANYQQFEQDDFSSKFSQSVQAISVGLDSCVPTVIEFNEQ